MNCFFCGQSVAMPVTRIERLTCHEEGYCSDECMIEDNRRLDEGNKIVLAGEAVLSDLNKLRLDASGMNPAHLTAVSPIRFGNTKMTETGRSEATSVRPDLGNGEGNNYCSKHGLFKTTDRHVCLKCESEIQNFDQLI